MAQDIFLTEISSKRKLQFPSLPSELTVTSETLYSSYTILDLGEVQFPKGSAPDRIEWEGIFFGASRKQMPFMRKWQAPATVVKMLDQWRKKGAPLKLVITGTNINIDVTIASFVAKPTGGDGDYNYSISFIQYSDQSVTVTKTKSTATTTSKKTTSRSSTKSTSYEVKKGDTLWAIAANPKVYGDGKQYTKIYNANKNVIESEAKKHGKKSSNNGHWIYPGTKLTIP